MSRAAVRALLDRAIRTRISIEAQAGSVDTLAVSAAIISGAHTDGAICADETSRAQTTTLQAFAAVRAIVGAEFAHCQNTAIIARVSRVAEA